MAETQEPAAEPNDVDDDEDSELLEPVMETRSRPAVNIGRLSGLGASAQGEHCSFERCHPAFADA